MKLLHLCCLHDSFRCNDTCAVFGSSYLQKKSCRKRLVSSKAVLCRCESYPPAPGAATRTDPHTRRWAACACRLSSKTWRSFEGPSDSRGLRCVTNGAPCCSAPRWGQRSSSRDKCRGPCEKCKMVQRKQTISKYPDDWNAKKRGQIPVINVFWLERFDLWRHLVRPDKSFVTNIRSQINSGFMGVFMLRSARPQSKTSPLGVTVVAIACLFYFNGNIPASCQPLRSQRPSEAGLSETPGPA